MVTNGHIFQRQQLLDKEERLALFVGAGNTATSFHFTRVVVGLVLQEWQIQYYTIYGLRLQLRILLCLLNSVLNSVLKRGKEFYWYIPLKRTKGRKIFLNWYGYFYFLQAKFLLVRTNSKNHGRASLSTDCRTSSVCSNPF